MDGSCTALLDTNFYGDGLMPDNTHICFKIDRSVKEDFQRKCVELGFSSVSGTLRAAVNSITYNGSLTPREQALARHLSKIQNTITLEETQKVYNDFCEFMDEHNYLAITARKSMDEFIELMDVFETDSIFAKQFFVMFNYALIPHEIPDLLRTYYHDSHVNQKRREKMTNVVRAHVEDTDITSLLTPAELKKIAHTTTT